MPRPICIRWSVALQSTIFFCSVSHFALATLKQFRCISISNQMFALIPRNVLPIFNWDLSLVRKMHRTKKSTKRRKKKSKLFLGQRLQMQLLVRFIHVPHNGRHIHSFAWLRFVRCCVILFFSHFYSHHI